MQQTTAAHDPCTLSNAMMIHKISHRIKLLIAEEVAQYGLTSQQAKMIIYLGAHGPAGQVAQKSLEEEFGLRSSSVTSLIHNAEKNGFVRRVPCPKDARINYLLLTEKGVEVCQKVSVLVESIEAKVFSQMTNGQQEMFASLLQKALEGLEQTLR